MHLVLGWCLGGRRHALILQPPLHTWALAMRWPHPPGLREGGHGPQEDTEHFLKSFYCVCVCGGGGRGLKKRKGIERGAFSRTIGYRYAWVAQLIFLHFHPKGPHATACPWKFLLSLLSCGCLSPPVQSYCRWDGGTCSRVSIYVFPPHSKALWLAYAGFPIFSLMPWLRMDINSTGQIRIDLTERFYLHSCFHLQL